MSEKMNKHHKVLPLICIFAMIFAMFSINWNLLQIMSRGTILDLICLPVNCFVGWFNFRNFKNFQILSAVNENMGEINTILETRAREFRARREAMRAGQ